MKRSIKTKKSKLIYIFFILFVTISLANMYFFAEGVVLSDRTIDLERKISALKTENQLLEKQLSSFTSLQIAQEIAGDLGFTQKAISVHLSNHDYAFFVE